MNCCRKLPAHCLRIKLYDWYPKTLLFKHSLQLIRVYYWSQKSQNETDVKSLAIFSERDRKRALWTRPEVTTTLRGSNVQWGPLGPDHPHYGLYVVYPHWVCLHAHEYPGYEDYPGFAHIQDMVFTWNREKSGYSSVYMINTSVPVTDCCFLFAHAPLMFTTRAGNCEIVNLTFLYCNRLE